MPVDVFDAPAGDRVQHTGRIGGPDRALGVPHRDGCVGAPSLIAYVVSRAVDAALVHIPALEHEDFLDVDVAMGRVAAPGLHPDEHGGLPGRPSPLGRRAAEE